MPMRKSLLIRNQDIQFSKPKPSWKNALHENIRLEYFLSGSENGSPSGHPFVATDNHIKSGVLQDISYQRNVAVQTHSVRAGDDIYDL